MWQNGGVLKDDLKDEMMLYHESFITRMCLSGKGKKEQYSRQCKSLYLRAKVRKTIIVSRD